MFDQITERFDSIVRRVRGLGKITDKNINDTARDIRRALLESDVNYMVVKAFIEKRKPNFRNIKNVDDINISRKSVKE